MKNRRPFAALQARSASHLLFTGLAGKCDREYESRTFAEAPTLYLRCLHAGANLFAEAAKVPDVPGVDALRFRLQRAMSEDGVVDSAANNTHRGCSFKGRRVLLQRIARFPAWTVNWLAGLLGKGRPKLSGSCLRQDSNPEKLVLTVSGKGTGSGEIKGSMVFNRKNYGMNKGIPFIKVADHVDVNFHLKGKRVGGPPLD